MNRFTADFSSSPPSTPAQEQSAPRNRPLFARFSDHPSTTPAGAPPSSAASFTPVGLPPSTAYGSSRPGTGVSKLQYPKDSLSSSVLQSSPPSLAQYARPARTKNGTPAKPRDEDFGTSNGSLGSSTYSQGHLSYLSEEDEHGADEGEGMRQNEIDEEDGPGSPAFRGFTGIDTSAARAGFQPASSLLQFDTKSTRRPQARSTMQERPKPRRLTQLPRKGKEEVVQGIARDIVARSRVASLNEPDDLLLQVESSMRKLNEDSQTTSGEEALHWTVTQHALDMIRLWQANARPLASQQESGNIGPTNSAPAFEKANYLASLLLVLHHPPSAHNTQCQFKAQTKSMAVASVADLQPHPVPQLLLDWLDNYHVSYELLFRAVHSASPNSTAHALFWDAIHSLVLRGKIREVSQLFAKADFKYAVSALEEGMDEPGYRGAQLQAVQSVIYRARQILDACPGTKSADWHVDGSDWDLFRKRVSTELDHLIHLAEGRAEDTDESFRAENFGIRKAGVTLLARATQKSVNALPWTVVQNLKIMYNVLLGSAEEIIAQSQDWLEATTSLTIWWDGTDEDNIERWSRAVSRAQHTNDTSAAIAPYLSRLRAAFLCVTDPDCKDSFPVNSMSPTEIGIGSILQGDLNAALGIIQIFSLCLSSTTAEIGALAGWLHSKGAANNVGLDQEDLMVLSFGGGVLGTDKDEFLHTYAEALFDHGELETVDGHRLEGWELGLSVTTRFDDQELAQSTITKFLEETELNDQDRVDRLVMLCTDLGLEGDARRVSERFADHLVNNTNMYGTALTFYARGHSSSKIRQVVDLLISYCLVLSKAYPAEGELDQQLQDLMEIPKAALSSLADVDPEAAEMLQFHLVGYACLRRYYSLRDEDIIAAKAKRKPNAPPLARKRLAAKALVAAINSAADSIYGGLYDAGRLSAIQVDGLLPLLGEATSFFSDHNTSEESGLALSSEQMYALLAAIEDLSTVNTRVYDASEECLQAALRNFHGSRPPSPRDMLKKSVSSGTNSNFSFSMMGSEMMANSGGSAGKSVGSIVMVGGGKADGERGWDWRAQYKEKNATGRDVLEALRHGIAKELSVAELKDEELMC